MDKLQKESSAAPDAGNAMLTQAESDIGCKYCAALKEVNDPEEGECQYCARNEAPAAEASLANCKYCADQDAHSECKYCNRPAMAAEAVNGSDCQYCADMAHRDSECKYCGAGPSVQNPTTTNSEDFAGQALNPPDIPKPILGEDPQGQITPMDDTTNNNLALDVAGQGESNVQVSAGVAPAAGPAESVQVDQSKEAMQAIAQQIVNDPSAGIEAGPGPQGADVALATDNASLVPGTSVVDGVSRPENFESNVPGDMALDEDNTMAPDLTQVLHEGLDSHAENIQRERVVQMVAQALSGFKQCKNIIERSQTQAPQLYTSSIMMLKAMIEMAKMLGLSENAEAQAQGQPQSEWTNPFPTHPENGGAPQSNSQSIPQENKPQSEWANPFPTHPENGGEGGAIGQPIGKLPTSATTEHVARVPLAPGAVNAQGQMKYVDPKTGKESFINMKEGRVLNNEGKPVKPGQG